jgi:hypothetical protein
MIGAQFYDSYYWPARCDGGRQNIAAVVEAEAISDNLVAATMAFVVRLGLWTIICF